MRSYKKVLIKHTIFQGYKSFSSVVFLRPRKYKPQNDFVASCMVRKAK